MNRWQHLPLLRPTALIAFLILGGLAQAQNLRQFPPKAQRGTLEVTQTPSILIDGAPARLSPGARIKGVNSLLVLSASLTGQKLVVNYVRDSLDLVHEVWILTPQEILEKPPAKLVDGSPVMDTGPRLTAQ